MPEELVSQSIELPSGELRLLQPQDGEHSGSPALTRCAAGNRRIYRLDPDGVGALRAYLDRFWNRSLAAFKAAVEQEEEEVT